MRSRRNAQPCRGWIYRAWGRARDVYLWYASRGGLSFSGHRKALRQKAVFPRDAYQRYTSLIGVFSRFQTLGSGITHSSLAEIPPPGFSAVKAHARYAAPKAALTALNPGGPLANKRSMDCSAPGRSCETCTSGMSIFGRCSGVGLDIPATGTRAGCPSRCR